MTEHLNYDLVRDYSDFQLRRYPEHLLVEVIIEGPFEEAGNRAFRYLFSYISGANRVNRTVAMTAPVIQDSSSEKIKMTAPVLQQGIAGNGAGKEGAQGEQSFRVAFILPQGTTLENAPAPTNPLVHLRAVPQSLTAVIRFSGRWSQQSYEHHRVSLTHAMNVAGLQAQGAPRFARFDPPFKPSFLRHNEIMIDVEDTE
ncbi:SOUL family heme-binding protein [Arthrobacter psychrochitiniphilus]|uniref:Heme-binding protein n=1 Tax=Arthrobacter psychrochitiniphilus TaxID=291045 RepID=A0A2V3DUU6_9MICC|nr:heme-binding protein [Arthrobacter psychrochitiniphilus]NYG16766.1 hypothetical protein [Arthrobacter psychrochitiniphilus]PXA69138.1 heme-binding protein [Arthrobacter psychrochitiniphilus]